MIQRIFDYWEALDELSQTTTILVVVALLVLAALNIVVARTPAFEERVQQQEISWGENVK